MPPNLPTAMGQTGEELQDSNRPWFRWSIPWAVSLENILGHIWPIRRF